MRVLSAVIPVFNEVRTFDRLMAKVAASPVVKEVVIVDDASTDGTRERLKRHANGQDPLPGSRDGLDIKVLFQEINQGKGAAIRTGLRMATSPYLVIQDADLEYDPADYQTLLRPLLKGEADVVYGSRFLNAEQQKKRSWHTWGNRFLTFLSNLVTGLQLTDMETCYKMFKTDLIQSLPLESNRFGFEPEVTAKVAKMKWRVRELPIRYHGRAYSEGKKIGWKDGVSAIYTIVRYSL